MRTAFSIFKPLIISTEVTELSQAARTIGSAFGSARKADVFLEQLQSIPLSEAVSPAQAEAFCAALASYRRNSYAETAAQLARPETSAFVLRLEALLLRLSTTSSMPLLDRPASKFARARLKHLLRQADKHGGNLIGLTPPELHRLRITLKKLRYGIEFFTGVLKPPRRWKRISALASELQDLLGVGNDAAETGQLLAGAAPDHSHGKATGFVIGWQARGTTGHSKQVFRKWKEFREAARL